MKQELMNRLVAFFGKNPTLLGEPATDEQIADAEKKLGVVMDKDYKEFIQNFGGAYAGIAIHAFSNGTSIGNETIVDLTIKARNLFFNTTLSVELNESFVIADDGAGNPIAIISNGQVVLFDYDTEKRQVVSNSFDEFIEENFAEW
ncbi:SMI1/KNR4 family protein [Porphyromonas circumdentaria]|uniref:Cell wall assembly regulator SMI1 n=1 Tax=Porphyromonas circumdentaria TaxID=29524 RepID=A0A1T4KK47_9PORP|nr:SMI1/KNR4 family protein [Porphyromonas circumdentaria]MBB6275013.1 cell wall assembly regulator SMI1 [Porphyromonas circumdentaria]SJZ42747.1 Cell wall assembly regulator SMI1 [Porphyromonas circumdentaria]